MPIETTILGELWAGEQDAEARRLEREALESIIGGGPKGRAGLRAPELAQLTPEQVGPSAYEAVRADPESLAVQRSALADLQRMGHDSGGVEHRAAANMAEMEAGRTARATTQAALASLAGRGMAGSGQALAARLAAGSSAANTAATTGTAAALDGRRQALQALQAGAGLATNMRGQAAALDTTKAGAADAINRFNASNRADTARFNVGTQQQGFDNTARVTGMANGARLDAAGRAREDANRRRRIMQGAGDMVDRSADAALGLLSGGLGGRK